jgi:hypothetical protein
MPKPGIHCVRVNDVRLDKSARCHFCMSKIGKSYIRRISTRAVYCGFLCYEYGISRSVDLNLRTLSS